MTSRRPHPDQEKRPPFVRRRIPWTVRSPLGTGTLTGSMFCAAHGLGWTRLDYGQPQPIGLLLLLLIVIVMWGFLVEWVLPKLPRNLSLQVQFVALVSSALLATVIGWSATMYLAMGLGLVASP